MSWQRSLPSNWIASDPWRANGGQRDLQRLHNAVVATEQVIPTMATIIESVTQIWKFIADLGAMINGKDGHVMVQADWQTLHVKPENTKALLCQRRQRIRRTRAIRCNIRWLECVK